MKFYVFEKLACVREIYRLNSLVSFTYMNEKTHKDPTIDVERGVAPRVRLSYQFG